MLLPVLVASARADVVFDGDVDPKATSNWNGSTMGYVGKTSDMTGSVLVNGGSELTSLGGMLGNGVRSVGSVTITGPGSTWTNGAGVFLGVNGAGTLTLEDGGRLSSKGAEFGYFAGSVGTAIITGAGSTWTNTTAFRLGSLGTATLVVEDGAELHNLTSSFVGYGPGSAGAATVAGPGSKWTNTYGLVVGLSGSGALRIEKGAQVTSDNGVISDASGTRPSIVSVHGSGSIWTNSRYLYVGSFGVGTLRVEHGGQAVNGDAAVGRVSGSSGTAIISGAGSQWINNGTLRVGDRGTGTMLIQDGAQVSNTYSYIGYGLVAGSEATVAGAGSMWNSSETLRVDLGKLSVEDGGEIRAKTLYVNNWSSANIHVSGNDMVVLGNATTPGAVSSSGTTKFFADAFLTSETYRPISDVQNRPMTFTGTFRPFGGTWNNTTKTLVVPAAAEIGAGETATLATGTRTVFTDAAGHRAGVSTGAVTGTPTMVASPMSGGQLDGIGLGTGEAVVAAWDFDTTLTGETLLSFDVGEGLSDLRAWRYSGGVWAEYDTHVVYREGIASFSVTQFSGYAVTAVPEPATWAMLAAAAAALGLWWHKRRVRA